MSADPVALGSYLKARRAARIPEAAGLPGGGRRRTPGLRREELAALAGVSIDYLIRLEQGRHREPSPDVLGALAGALGLTADGRRHLFGLGGRDDPGRRLASRRSVPQPLRRLVEGASPNPAWILNRRRDILVWNTGADALFGDLGALADAERNLLHLTFCTPRVRALWSDWPLVAQDAVAQLRAILAAVAPDPAVDALVAGLRSTSPEFASLWAQQDVARACNPVRRVHHPIAGELSFEVELLDAADGDLQLVVLDCLDPAGRERWSVYVAARARASPADRRLRVV